MTSPDVILVHGLYHQPAHLRPLVDALEGLGVVVHTPRLHRASLAADTSEVQRVAHACGTRPILVGHSYGGAVAAGVQGAASFVFIAAFVPRIGESCARLGGADAPVNARVQPHPKGGTFVPADAAAELFYGDCDPLSAQHAIDLLVPQAPGHGRGVVQDSAWERSPSHFILCSEDQAMSPDVQLRMALRCDTYETIDASHSPFISQPQLVAASIVRAGGGR